MIDNEKVKNAIAGWAKSTIYSKPETDFFDQCGYIGNFSKNEVITFYAGYAARDKEAEEEKQELIEMLIDIAEYRLFYEDSMDQNTGLEIKIKTLIEKATGKQIDEVVSDGRQ